MKRIVFLGLLSLILCGCAVVSPNTGKVESDQKINIDMGIPNLSPEPESTISSQEKESYSKMEVENKDIDVKKMMKLVHGKEQLTSFKKGKMGEQTAQIDGIKHIWQKTENKGILYTNDRGVKESDKKKAEKVSENFIERFCKEYCLSFCKESEKKDEDNSYTFCYSQTWEGVKVMGNKTVYLPNNDEKPIHGSYIEVTVDGTGIISLFLQQVFDVKKTVKSYQMEKDFIVRDKILETAKKYYENLYTDLQEKAEMEIQGIQVMYMPYKDGNAQYFVPVYDVTIKEKARKEPICMLIDAVTAYVYYAQ